MTQDELVKLGINRFRRDIWADPQDYVRIDILGGGPGGPWAGPWATLWARRTQQLILERTPQKMLNVEDTTTDYLPYDGPLDPEDTQP